MSHVTTARSPKHTLMSNNSTRDHQAVERDLSTALFSRDLPMPIGTGSQPLDAKRKLPESPVKPFFGAGGKMLKQFDEHHAGLTRQSSRDSGIATPPRSVVGIGGKGVYDNMIISGRWLTFRSHSG